MIENKSEIADLQERGKGFRGKKGDDRLRERKKAESQPFNRARVSMDPSKEEKKKQEKKTKG